MTRKRVTARTRHARAKKAGIASLGGYNAQLVRQGGGCAICGEPPKARRLHIDHDHLTGQVRGLLCWTCNATIGRAHDHIMRLRVAAAYLEFGCAVAVVYRQGRH